jgi:beta-lactamase regulating signal transducer with metallopeptidase domain
MPPITVENAGAFVFQCTVIALGAAAALRVFDVERARLRYAIWQGVLALSLLLPLVQPWRFETIVLAPLSRMATTAAPSGAAVYASVAASPFSWLGLLWIAGVAARLTWLCIGAWRLRILAGRATGPCPDAASLQAQLGTQATVRYADGVRQPATCGIIRPLVLLPPRLRALDADVRRAVLVHELLHVQRGDWARLIAEEVLRAALWFSPATWWLIDRVHGAREEVVDVDAAALAGGRRTYVRALLEFAGEPALAATPAFAQRRHLLTRITRLCKEPTMSVRRVVFTAALALLSVSAATAGAIAAFPVSAADEVLVAPAVQLPPPPPPERVQVPPPPPPAPAPPVVTRSVPPPPPPTQPPPAPPIAVSNKTADMPPPPPPPPMPEPATPIPAIERQGPPPPPPAPPKAQTPPPEPPKVAARVTIKGQVNSEGTLPLTPGMTVGDAIAIAGGYTDRAGKNRLTITREVKGKRKTISAKEEDVLQPGDILNVPTRWW